MWLRPRANGFLSCGEVPAADVLWCLATGTGLGPFLSMLRTDEPWDQFEHVVLVHAVRHANELTYRDVIAGIDARARRRFTSRRWSAARPIRERALRANYRRRSPTAASRRATGVPLTAENAHAMLCGNPAMVDDMQGVLDTRGMRRHRRSEPGHYHASRPIGRDGAAIVQSDGEAVARRSRAHVRATDLGDVRESAASAQRAASARRGSAKRFHRLNAPATVDASCGLVRSSARTCSARERVARAVLRVEARQVATGERADQRAHAVGIARIEARVREQRAHARERAGRARCRLQREPLVEHQRLVAPSSLRSANSDRSRAGEPLSFSAASAAIASVMLSARVELRERQRSARARASSRAPR